MFQNENKRALRRGWPIHGYVGPNGGGKSAAMVWDTIKSLELGRPVLGTVRLLDYLNPRDCADPVCAADPYSGHHVRAMPDRDVVAELFKTERDPQRRVQEMRALGEIVGVHRAAHRLWVPLVDWQQVLDARGVDLLLDEVTGAASSRESSALPAAIANKLVQLRRNDVIVRWSAPSWMRADKIIRECSQAVTYCTGHLPVRDGDETRQWRRRRLFRWKTYDAQLFEDFTAGKRQELPALSNDWHWGPKSPSFLAYDTYDSVLTVGTVNESGSCYRCGGTRRRPACKCPDNHEAGESVVAAPLRGPRLRGGSGGATATTGPVAVGPLVPVGGA